MLNNQLALDSLTQMRESIDTLISVLTGGDSPDSPKLSTTDKVMTKPEPPLVELFTIEDVRDRLKQVMEYDIAQDVPKNTGMLQILKEFGAERPSQLAEADFAGVINQCDTYLEQEDL